MEGPTPRIERRFVMDTATVVPVTVQPEAAALVAELGYETAYEQMLDYIRHNVAGLRRIAVTYGDVYEPGEWPAIIFEVYRDPATNGLEDRTWHRVSDWKISTFHPDVWRYFTVFLMDDIPHAG
jgi:hypothetical protein